MLSGASTVLTLDAPLAEDVEFSGGFEVETEAHSGGGVFVAERASTINLAFADIRNVTLHEVIGAPFTLHAEHQPTTETSGSELYYYGTDSQAQVLLNRTILLAGPDDADQTVTVTEVQSLAAADAERDLFRRLTHD